MNKHALKMMLAIGLLTLAAASAGAQAARGSVVVRIPFEFYVGAEKMPAGRYTIGRATQNSSRVISLRSADGRATVMAMTDDADGGADPRARLDFHRYGRSYFLRQVVTPEAARALRESELERETARRHAAPRRDLARTREVVTILLRQK